MLISPIIYYATNIGGWLLYSLLFLAWFFDFKLYIFTTEPVFFFSVGLLFSRNISWLRKIDWNNWNNMNYYIGGFIVILFSKLFIDNALYSPFLSTFFLKLLILVGLFVTWTYYDNIKVNVLSKGIVKALLVFKKYSFFVFVSHMIILHIIKKALLYLIGTNQIKSILIYFLTLIITVLICCACAKFLSNYSKRFYSILTGGR